MDKAKDMVGGHHSTTSANPADEEKLPGNIVAVTGGTYDAGPGVKSNDSNDPPKTVSDPHDTSKGISFDDKPKSESAPQEKGAADVAADDKVAQVEHGSEGGSDVKPKADAASGTESSSANKKDNYDPEDVERKDNGEAKAPATSEGPEKVFDK